MPSPWSVLQFLSFLPPAVSALSLLQPRDASAPRVVRFDLRRNHIDDPATHDRNRFRRRDTVNVTLDNQKSIYGLRVTVGSPEQSFDVSVDTGSSDLWLNSGDSDLCTSSGSPCRPAGSYSANDSSTYSYLDSAFNITYADGSGASGDYVTDTLRLGARTVLRDFQFGVGYQSTSPQNILGIGYRANEAALGLPGGRAYRNLPLRLVSDGAIASPAYSLWLNDLDAKRGTLLFGGVDRAHYAGDLVTLPVQAVAAPSAAADVFAEFWVTLSSLELGGQTVARDLGLAVLLDSGTSLTYLPDDLAASIYDAVGAQFDSSTGVAVVDCSLARQSANLTFLFDSPARVDVPLDELVFTDQAGDGAPRPGPSSDRGDEVVAATAPDLCTFGIAPSGGGSVVLGDTFLRSAYVVFDLANNEVAIAQAVHGVRRSDVVEIGTGGDAVSPARDADENVSATVGLPTQQTLSAGGEGELNPIGGGGDDGDGDDDSAAAGMLAPPRRRLWCIAVLSAVVGFAGLLV